MLQLNPNIFCRSLNTQPIYPCLRLLMMTFLVVIATVIMPAQSAESLESPILQDARLEKFYQQVLFAYYQDDLDGALLQYSLLEWYYPQGLHQLPEHLYLDANEPELLKAGISLAFGLEDQAADIFKALLATYHSPQKRTRAWFSLGKIYYQQGQWLKASQAFSNIDNQAAEDYLAVDNQDHLLYLRAQLYNQQGLGEQGDVWQQQLSSDSIYHYYLQYNQALVNLQSGNTEQAIQLLTQLSNGNAGGLPQIFASLFNPLFATSSISSEVQYEAQQQEILAIQDRVNLTLAYTLLQQGNAHAAYEAFARIRREGLDGEAALLGYGWAAAKSDELQIALGIWHSLMAQPKHTEYSLEAYLASAYAFEKGFAPRQAVATLQQGMHRFKQVINDLAVAQQQVKHGPFIQALAHDFVALNPSVELSAKADDSVTSDNSLLLSLIHNAGMNKSFRNQLAALQQSQNLANQLREWQQSMAHYSLMLDERQAQRVTRAQAMLQARIFDKLSALQERRDKLAEQLLAAQQQDASMLMPVVYQQSLARLTRAQSNLSEINQRKNELQQLSLKPEYADRLRRIQGILSWQADEEFANNNWQAQKALNQLDAEIKQTAKRQNRLLALLAARPDYAEQRQRVAQLSQRIATQLLHNQSLQSQLVGHLSSHLENNISQFKAKIDGYMVQAQLALVRLSDQALQQNQNDKDARPVDIGRPPELGPTGQQP